jgi:hypothetical protein
MSVNAAVEGDIKMTKLKARQRAKAKAVQKTRKKVAAAGQGDQPSAPGRFDAGSGSIRGSQLSATNNGFAGAKAGSAG